MKLDELVTRHFTKELENTDKSVYDLFDWKKVNVQIIDRSTGDTILSMEDLEFPESYSQSACDIIASKYFRKKGVPNERNQEYSMRQLVHRMVQFWCDALESEWLLEDGKKQIVYDELVYMLLAQIWAPNSPQWFNTGLKTAYNISGRSQGHYYYNEDTGQIEESEDAYTRTQGSACFIISVADSLIGERSLTNQIATETLLFKYGSGVGTNWSPIRAKDEFLSGGGKSSGLLSFLKVSDRNAGAIKSGGTTRRAAKMNILDLEHPEILDFIRWKSIEEDKVVALGKMGYSTDFDGEAYETVSGQNANNSVRIPNAFMEKLENQYAQWHVTGRVDPSRNDTILVKQLWNELAKAAWRCGDPGVQYDDIINAWNTCPCGEDGKLNAKHNRINASNPCSEYMFLDDTACNLASINIMKFYNSNENTFDMKAYLHTIKMTQLVLEATIYSGQFPTKEIARKSYNFRTTGLGLTNLGNMFMHMAIPYDSDEARNIGASLLSILTGYSYYISALMAEKIGPFASYDINKQYMKEVIRNHAVAANYDKNDTIFRGLTYTPLKIQHDIIEKMGFHNITATIKAVWKLAIEQGEASGYRNAQVSVLAPTGTIAFAMDCATTSAEPFFSHVAYKKLVGGGFMEIINPALPEALKKLGYTKEEISEIIGFVMRKEEKNGYNYIADGTIENAPQLLSQHLSIFDTANRCGTGKRYIQPSGHVKMMAMLTPHVSGAISKTVNLPNDSTVKDVEDIYKLSWKLGVKAIALYRDGCKASQPLNSIKTEGTTKPLTDYTYEELLEHINTEKATYKPLRIKPKGIRTAHVHEAQIDGLKLYITTSFYEDGKIGEIYVSSGRQGSLVKGLLDSISTTLSEMLQYGVPPEDIAKMYRGQKFEPSGFVSGHPYIKSVDSISDLISKIIDIELGNFTYCQVKPNNQSKQIKPDEQNKQNKTESITHNSSEYLQGEVCSACKSAKLIRNGICKVCTECGTTTGCS